MDDKDLFEDLFGDCEEFEGVDEDDEKMECGKCEPERISAGGDERQVRKMGDPRKPTAAEVEDHNRTHLPYRNWCLHCIRGKGKDMDHRKGIEEERGLSEYSFDYCFPGDEFGFKLTIFVGNERATGMKMATVVPTKGASGRFSAERILEFMEECGDGGMLL